MISAWLIEASVLMRSKVAKEPMSAVKGMNVVVVLAVKKSITKNLPNYHAFLTLDVRTLVWASFAVLLASLAKINVVILTPIHQLHQFRNLLLAQPAASQQFVSANCSWWRSALCFSNKPFRPTTVNWDQPVPQTVQRLSSHVLVVLSWESQQKTESQYTQFISLQLRIWISWLFSAADIQLISFISWLFQLSVLRSCEEISWHSLGVSTSVQAFNQSRSLIMHSSADELSNQQLTNNISFDQLIFSWHFSYKSNPIDILLY